MHNLLTNLLPPERLANVRREYFLRLGVVATMLAACLVVVAAALLVPTYVYLSATMEAKANRLAGVEKTLSSSEESALSARLATLAEDAATLSKLKGSASATETVRAALEVAHPGVSLTGVNYVAAAGKSPATVALTGTAKNRDALRSYQLALQGASFVKSADLPVSVFAKSTDIEFTVTLTLRP